MYSNLEIETQIEARYGELIDFIAELAAFAETIAAAGAPASDTRHKDVALGFLARGTDALMATQRLFNAGLPDDAGSPMRTIAELLIDLRWIGAEETEARLKLLAEYDEYLRHRARERFRRYVQNDAEPLDRKLHQAEGSGLDFTEWRRRRDARAAELAKRFGKQSSWTLVGTYKRAAAVGLVDIYEWPYQSGCEAVHSGPAILDAWKAVGDSHFSLRAGPRVPDDGVLMVTTASCFIQLCGTVIDVCDKPELGAKLQELDRKLVELAEQDAAARIAAARNS